MENWIESYDRQKERKTEKERERERHELDNLYDNILTEWLLIKALFCSLCVQCAAQSKENVNLFREKTILIPILFALRFSTKLFRSKAK